MTILRCTETVGGESLVARRSGGFLAQSDQAQGPVQASLHERSQHAVGLGLRDELIELAESVFAAANAARRHAHVLT